MTNMKYGESRRKIQKVYYQGFMKSYEIRIDKTRITVIVT